MQRSLLAHAALLTVAVPAAAQGRSGGTPKKEYSVTQNRAMMVTRQVLVNQGFELLRVENVGNDRIVYYRGGNIGNGKGKGPPLKFIIRRGGQCVVFVDTAYTVSVDVSPKVS